MFPKRHPRTSKRKVKKFAWFGEWIVTILEVLELQILQLHRIFQAHHLQFDPSNRFCHFHQWKLRIQVDRGNCNLVQLDRLLLYSHLQGSKHKSHYLQKLLVRNLLGLGNVRRICNQLDSLHSFWYTWHATPFSPVWDEQVVGS